MEGTIKSARRVLEIFEFFAQTHAPATVKELSQCLGYPQSSTSLLLKSLLTQGYLRYDAASRTYYPTLRVMLLGSWVHDEIFGNGSVISLLEGLRREFGHSVLLGMRQGVYVRYIVTLCAETTGLPPYATGILRPVCRAAVGKALLAGLRNAEISLIARRANAQETDPACKVAVPELLADIELCRARGWAESQGRVVAGRNVIATALPPVPGQMDLAIGLGGPQDEMAHQREEIVERLRQIGLTLQGRASLQAEMAAWPPVTMGARPG
ncbi:MAG: helix-turn-helix domain-containing protein [Pigmentiphaga sp.]|uniref:IclR family transcriptional regulator n=1 Tax=Pigmentiphaga sp. TaxID=1977564 RepID=UPI0029BE145D|nr:helix-turn-helix domain-containing protein [Pigmentiphaga sp.]MDX3906409.1 helix-turn-helix domain-containing protein [Pigmentiphaga sp.]